MAVLLYRQILAVNAVLGVQGIDEIVAQREVRPMVIGF